MRQMNPLSSDKPLIVYLDFKSPYAYLAKDPTVQLERDFQIEIDWRPLTLDIPSFLGSARTDDKGNLVENNRTPRQWNGVRYAYMDAKRYARLKDMILYGPQKIWDSSIASIGMLWAKAQRRVQLMAYMDLVFERFWRRELDIEDLKVIEEILDEAGCAVDGFRDYLENDGRQLHDQLQDALHPAGIFGVPTYIIGSERFFGREHLPMVRWILEGRPGAKPDIAYQHFPEKIT